MNKLSKIILGGYALLGVSMVAEAAQPTIVVTPGKMWANQKGFVIKSNRNGKEVSRIDYDKAFVDPEFFNVQAAIQGVFSEQGFLVPDASSQSEDDEFEEMVDEAFEGGETGSGVQTNALDELLKTTKPDIRLEIDWNMNTNGSLYSCDFTLRAIDAYSSKVISSIAAQTGERRRTVPVTVALKEATKQNMGTLCDQMNAYFDDIESSGREIRMSVRVVDNGAGINMNSEVNGESLSTVIQDWLNDNTVNHQNSLRNSGRNMMNFDQIRIPLHKATGGSLTALDFAGQLQKYLRQFGISSDVSASTLGMARIFIGEK